MKPEEKQFFRDNPEGAVIVALESGRDGLLSGAVELRGGEASWLEYELESGMEEDAVSLYRGAGDTPVLEYRARGRRVDVVTPPDRLLILWNRGRRGLAVDGEPLSPGELCTSAPAGVTPWLLRFAGWLPKGE